jgi:signal transduction histidine kinase
LSIEVVDDGIGLSESAERRSGLANLAARAENHGGSFAAYRAPAGGTAIEWVVPLVSGSSET